MPTRLFCWAFISVSLMKLSRDYRSECGSPTLVETYVNTAGTKRNGRGSVKSCQPNKSVASVLPVSRLFRKHFLKMHPSLSLSHSLTLSLSHSLTLSLSHSLTLSLSHSPTLSLSHSPTLPLSHSPTLPLSHSPTLPLSHSPTLPLFLHISATNWRSIARSPLSCSALTSLNSKIYLRLGSSAAIGPVDPTGKLVS